MKVYTLTIAYNEKTEEIEYIQEYVEEESPGVAIEWELALGSDATDLSWDNETLIALIEEHGLGEA